MGRPLASDAAGSRLVSHDGLPPFEDLDVSALSPSMRRLAKALLLYKSMFSGPWFRALSEEEDPETKLLYQTIMSETRDQAKLATDLLHEWDPAGESEKVEAVTDRVLQRLLSDMIALKMSSTEVFLAAGINAPDLRTRSAFLQLADIDRRHADSLRAAVGARAPTRPPSIAKGKRADASHVGPFPSGTLSRKLQETIEDARRSGHAPARIVVSGMALRHLRDEGAVPPHQGDIMGLPAEVDLSWEGEEFALVSRERISLAEIVTELEADRPEPGRH